MQLVLGVEIAKVVKRIDPMDSLYKESKEIGEGKVQGYDFGKEFDARKFLASFKETGFQATNLGRAIELVKQMQKEKVTIFLGFTSNISLERAEGHNHLPGEEQAGPFPGHHHRRS